ncbi:MAG: glycosyltransferase [Paludibacteraceae bacterium]|nr:glycosyltransferase [Paludibacteraceae bacterium]
MKVLWFEVTTPKAYNENGDVVGGWQDALENIVREYDDIELFVAFQSSSASDVKVVGRVTYIPLRVNFSFFERILSRFSWRVLENKLLPLCEKVINEYKPDVVHVFGNEWPYGLAANQVNVPFVIHIQGAIVPYENAKYPPKYNGFTVLKALRFSPVELLKLWASSLNDNSRLLMEQRIWKSVVYYMGRTDWDYALTSLLNPKAHYFHVEESLRPEILRTTKHWRFTNGKVKLLTIGASSFWKGMDNLLKTAHLLKESGLDFEWKVAGSIPLKLKKIIERTENLCFADCNVEFLGFIDVHSLVDLIVDSSMYVHTAYIENSPNSICEAQFLGLPVVSTCVGGISSLLKDKLEGILVPANDPWQMAETIISLSKDRERLELFSGNSKERAIERHSRINILNQLIDCYTTVIEESV